MESRPGWPKIALVVFFLWIRLKFKCVMLPNAIKFIRYIGQALFYSGQGFVFYRRFVHVIWLFLSTPFEHNVNKITINTSTIEASNVQMASKMNAIICLRIPSQCSYHHDMASIPLDEVCLEIILFQQRGPTGESHSFYKRSVGGLA